MDKIIEAFQGGRLQIDFTSLTLLQNTSDNPIEYHGTGYIRQIDDATLSVQLYSVETKNTDWVKDLKNSARAKSGKLFTEADYYTLTGLALDGSIWTAKQLLPNCIWPPESSRPVVKAAISHCERGQGSGNAMGMRLHYFDRADIPCVINQVAFAACGLEFNIERKDDSFTIEVKSKVPLPAHLEVKIEEAIRFLLAQTVSLRALEGPRQHLQLYSRYPSSPRTRLGPPISRGGPAFNGHSWKLFADYLAYVLPGAEPYWHICSNHLHNACETSANALDAWAIGLSVAVEGLANLLPKELDPEQKKRLEALQTFINGQVSASPAHKAFAPRVAGMVNGLTSIRAIDRMNALAENGGTLPAFVKDWQKLRNRGVHPSKRGGDLAQADFQRLIDEVHHVTVLMYHIVFALINYTGPYTNYAKHGFPECAYPPVAATTQTAMPASPPAPESSPTVGPAASAKKSTPRERSESAPKKKRRPAKSALAKKKGIGSPSSKLRRRNVRLKAT